MPRQRSAPHDGARLAPRGTGSVVVFLAVLLLLAVACAGARPVVLASTTSTEDSGLLEVLLPAFEAAQPGHAIRLVAVGSGQALELGMRGDADVLLVHSPAAESTFMAAGHGSRRRPVMHNDFVLLGPPSDPAGVRGVDIVAALARIAAAGAPFISRGDHSGTHAKELALWREAGIDPAGAAWYSDVGQGMGETLAIAGERGGYTLADRGTWLALRHRDALELLVERDRRLFNPYSVIVAARARNRAGAEAFADWITSAPARALIREFGRARFGEPLFVPDPAASR